MTVRGLSSEGVAGGENSSTGVVEGKISSSGVGGRDTSNSDAEGLGISISGEGSRKLLVSETAFLVSSLGQYTVLSAHRWKRKNNTHALPCNDIVAKV